VINLIDFLENHLQKCSYKKYLGIECPGCGFQTSFILLLKGKFMESFIEFPCLLPILIFIIFLILHSFFKFSKGEIIIIYMFIFIIAILTISFIFKLLAQY